MTGRFLRALALWGVLLAAGWTQAVRADDIVVDDVFIHLTDEGYALSADFGFTINARLEEALENGLALYFLIEFQLERSRWYWFNDRAADRTQRIRLWYHALTRQYRVSTGALSQSFATLDEARRAMSRVRNWIIADRGRLSPDVTYDGYLRMRLDVSQLPKPFQLTTLGNREWTLASDWKHVRFTPGREGAR